MYLYAGKITCMDCDQKFRGKKQRDKKVYICNGYHNKSSSCERFAISEEELTGLVTNHFAAFYRYPYQQEEFYNKYGEFNIAEYVDRVEVNNKQKEFVIKYTDKSHDTIKTLNRFLL